MHGVHTFDEMVWRCFWLQRAEGEGVEPPTNVLGMDLQCCCDDVRGTGIGTGFFRDGHCSTGPTDEGRHTGMRTQRPPACVPGAGGAANGPMLVSQHVRFGAQFACRALPVCVQVTEQFLAYSKEVGNDLSLHRCPCTSFLGSCQAIAGASVLSVGRRSDSALAFAALAGAVRGSGRRRGGGTGACQALAPAPWVRRNAAIPCRFGWSRRVMTGPHLIYGIMHFTCRSGEA